MSVCWHHATVAALWGGLALPAPAESPFAVAVIEFAPAPGQFVNDAGFNDPLAALGAPSGGGTFVPDNTSIVSLGGFGGFITLRFDHVVEDDPLNWFGMDAIVFGNASWADDKGNRHWAECATIEIALDANGNGWIDEGEGWYLIPGSHIADPAAHYASRSWDDDPETGTPPANLSWVPPGYSGSWTTIAYELPPNLFGQAIIENPSTGGNTEGIYGYAEYTPTLVLGDTDADNEVDNPLMTPEAFYTVPDDPFTVGISHGSGGGDAFDIAWAIDGETGQPAGLAGFDFIRITNPTDVILPFFNEKSPEIDGVADAAPDPFGDCDEDGDIDLSDFACVQMCFGRAVAGGELCVTVDRNADALVDLFDVAAFKSRVTGPG